MTASRASARSVRSAVLSEDALFTTTLIAFVVWQIGGHIDVWYHAHYGFQIESFVTWPHALLYAGWLASAAPAVLYLLTRGERDLRSLPPGYLFVVAGAIVFGIGGALDLAWHTAFGFEVNHEALVSPSHLVLIFSSGVGCVGLAWAAIARRGRRPTASLALDLGVAITLGILFRVGLFSMLYSNPFSIDYAAGGAMSATLFGFSGIRAWTDQTAQVAGTSGMTVFAIIVALFVTVPLRRLQLAGGATAVMLLWAAAIGVIAIPESWIYVPAIVAGAVVAEAIWARMRAGAFGGVGSRRGYWLMSFAVPTTILYGYFAIMAVAGGGIAWSVPLWAGAPVLAGVYALGATAFAIPPTFALGHAPGD
jgi:hypothetical protein